MRKHDRTHSLLLEALSLKNLPRRGWVLRNASRESVAEHTYGVCIFALVLAKMEKLTARQEALLLKLATLHDLHETRIGDLVPYEKKKLKPDEKGVERQMLSGTVLEEELATLQKAPKKIVLLAKDADLLDMLFRAVENKRRGDKRMEEFIDSAMDGIRGASARKLAREALRTG